MLQISFALGKRHGSLWIPNEHPAAAMEVGVALSPLIVVLPSETWSGERSAELVSTSETRNPKPETRNRLWRLTFPRTAIEARNPKPETDSEDLTGPIKTRNPKPETRNPKPTLYFPQDRSKPETRNPKPETRNPKPTLKTDTFPMDRSNPETRNPKPTAKVGFNRRNPKPETRNPKPETRNRLWRLTFPRTDRNPKPETQNPKPTLKTDTFPMDRSNPETRNPKPTAKVGFKRRNPKPETRNRQRKLVSIDETRNPKPETRKPKPTRIRLLGGSPDRNSAELSSRILGRWLHNGSAQRNRW